MNRQTLIKGALTTSLALKSGSLLKADFLKDIAIIDTHQHLWDLDRFNLAWNDKNAGGPLNKNFDSQDYLKAISGINIEKTIYMEVNISPEQRVQEVEYILKLCRDKDNLTSAMIISGPVESEGFVAYIQKLKNYTEVKGVRRVLHGKDTKRGTCLEATFVKNMQLLGELNLSFDLCMRSSELEDALSLVKQAPKTRFIIDHCGNIDPYVYLKQDSQSIAIRSKWQRDMIMLAEQDEVYCKISGIVASMKKGSWKTSDIAPVVNFCLDTFGPDRVLFGSDWPVCNKGSNFLEWVEALKSIVENRPEDHQKKLFRENAISCYQL